MKTWKQSVFFGLVAIIAFGFGFVGCDEGNAENVTPEPHEFKEKTFTITYEEINHPIRIQGTLTNNLWNSITEKIKIAVEEAHEEAINGSFLERIFFQNVFLSQATLVLVPDLTITTFPVIILDSDADYESYKAVDINTLRFNIDYLSDATDLVSIINTAVEEMFDIDINPSIYPEGFWFTPYNGHISSNTFRSSLYLTIPSNINGKPVTYVFFHKNDFITGVTLADGIRLSNNAFTECSNLASVTFEGSSIYGWFSDSLSFDGGYDLFAKYQAGGAGTYTTTRTGDGSDSGLSGPVVWTKQ
jgi:hypothetical protein